MATTDEPEQATADGSETWEHITWVDIGPDGEECERSGVIWSVAEPLVGMRAWWVIPAGDPGEQVLLVARASRRHQVGRQYLRPFVSLMGQQPARLQSSWNPTGGRFVDIGEHFRETDPRSRFNRTFTPPTHLRMKPMDATARNDLAVFERMCEDAARPDAPERRWTAWR